MSYGMSVCKLCSGDFVRQVDGRPSEKPRWILVPCILVEVSATCSSAPSLGGGPLLGRQVCSMNAAPHRRSSIAVLGGAAKGVDVSYGSCTFRKQWFDFSSISLPRTASSSSGKNSLTRRRVEIEARLSDVSKPSPGSLERSLSDKFREVVSDATETTFRDDTSSSTSSLPSPSGGGVPVNLAAGAGITAAVFMMVLLGFVAKPRTGGGGSVSDLIRRGQLRSDRGGASSGNLTYDDPFNNPLVKTGKKNPVVKMCGKIFRLEPITLTDEKVARHQRRRIQAYKWKRPTVFLNEGDPLPIGLDPEEVRWIPSNHPFATTSNFIDEDLAQKNIYQTKGVPSRVRAEHEALRKKILETAQREPEFKLPNKEDSGAEAWKTSDESRGPSSTSLNDKDEGSVSGVGFAKQVNGNGGNDNRLKNGGLQGGLRNGISEPRYRSIDFSGEEQGLNRN